MQFKNRLNSIKISGSMSKYLLEIKDTVDALFSVGEQVKDDDHVNAILHGLTEEFVSLITSIVIRPGGITVPELEVVLLSHESMLERYKKPEQFIQANLAYHNGRGSAREHFRGKEEDMKEVEASPQELSASSAVNLATLQSTAALLQDQDWYPDSGAAHHMMYDARNLTDQADYAGHERVIIGNDITKNLMSVYKFCCDNHVYFEFHHDNCCVKSQETREVVLKGVVDKGLYRFLNFNIENTQSSAEAAAAFLTNSEPANDSLLWHARLGHPSNNVLYSFTKFDNAPEYVNLSKSLQSCGVIHRFSCPHTLQQNGNAKWKHRHVVEMGLTLEAFQTVVYLINALPTPTLQNQSPMETLSSLNASLCGAEPPTTILLDVPAAQAVPIPLQSPEVVLPLPITSATQNCHPMITRGKLCISKPWALHAQLEHTSIKQALSDSKWRATMDAEYSAFMQNRTWNLVKLPPNREPIGSKWVFWIKYNADGIDKYKARLVAQGFHQRPGLDYKETFSPVVKPASIRIMLSLALANSWPIKQLDVNNAFLHGDLLEDVYMSQPKGYEQGDGTLVCKLTKALYGLKQATRAWYVKLLGAFKRLGFTPTKSDTSLFTRITPQSRLYAPVYVDDIILTGDSSPTIIKSFSN
ncbi:uncharacterized protein LOC107615995 [Arachis ipaensis]|uniref:uncharacterized protein LOC107615995 n=1 Tax=Arachis ipaensis TaxID=130454 RepID=UPI0007AF549B|nr:uncharacterized protein LOC107615995 [Arachis ipaensis]